MTRTKKYALVLLGATGLVAATALLVWRSTNVAARPLFLEPIPESASALVFVNVSALRTSPFLGELRRWLPAPHEDPDYKNFVQTTGFDYERDLDQVLVISFKPTGDALKGNATEAAAGRELLAIAETHSDPQRLLAYAKSNGRTDQVIGHEAIRIDLKNPSETFYFAILNKRRVAVATSLPALARAWHTGAPEPEWPERILRVAGSPIFLVLRQDSAALDALTGRAPQAFTSPELFSLIKQLEWITLAGKPDQQRLEVVLEGETFSESATRQLADLLNGVVLLAEAGLNEAKTRERLDPGLRAAYLALLASAEVRRLDRGKAKSVRLSFDVTPEFLEQAQRATPRIEPSPTMPRPKQHKAGT
jgi:hypothetical protein